MDETKSTSKQLVITNGVPTNLSSLQMKGLHKLNDLKPAKFIITLRPRTRIGNNEKRIHYTIRSRLEEGDQFVITSTDALKGKTILSNFRQTSNKQSDGKSETTTIKTIEVKESSGKICVIENSESHDLKATQSVIDLSRLSGGSDTRRPLSPERRSVNFIEISAKTTNSSSKKESKENQECLSEELINEAKIKSPPPYRRKKNKAKHCKSKDAEVIDYSEGNDFSETPPTNSSGHIKDTYNLEKTEQQMAARVMRSDKCARIDSLEVQMFNMRRELSRIREEYATPEDFKRINALTEQLRELNSLLSDLRNTCYRRKFTETPEEEEEVQRIETMQKVENLQTERKTVTNCATMTDPSSCEKFTETLPWPTEYNNCIITDVPDAVPQFEHFRVVNDYRVDPQVRKERLEKKEASRCQKNQEAQYPDVEENETAEANTKCLQVEWDTTPIPPLEEDEEEEEYKDYSPCNAEQKRTSESQTEPRKWGPSKKKKSKCSRLSLKSDDNGDTTTNESNTQSVEDIPNRCCLERSESEYISTASSRCEMCANMELPLLTSNLHEAISEVIEDIEPSCIALTILLQVDNLYHINISIMRTGQSLGCLYATEECIVDANQKHVFEEFLTFFVVDSMNTMEQKNKILSHSFDFIKN